MTNIVNVSSKKNHIVVNIVAVLVIAMISLVHCFTWLFVLALDAAKNNKTFEWTHALPIILISILITAFIVNSIRKFIIRRIDRDIVATKQLIGSQPCRKCKILAYLCLICPILLFNPIFPPVKGLIFGFMIVLLNIFFGHWSLRLMKKYSNYTSRMYAIVGLVINYLILSVVLLFPVIMLGLGWLFSQHEVTTL